MVEIPPLAGWPTEYPESTPTRAILIVYDDLEELQENIKLAKEEPWLEKFARNTLELKEFLDHSKHSKDTQLLDIRNWFVNAKINHQSLNDALFDFNESNFQDISSVRSFVNELVTEDFSSLESLKNHLELYLKTKNL